MSAQQASNASTGGLQPENDESELHHEETSNDLEDDEKVNAATESINNLPPQPSKCHCGKVLKEHETSLSHWLCHRCWKLQNDSIYYQCGDCPRCDNEIKDKCYQLCTECAFLTQHLFPNPDQNINSIIMNKIESTLDMIS